MLQQRGGIEGATREDYFGTGTDLLGPTSTVGNLDRDRPAIVDDDSGGQSVLANREVPATRQRCQVRFGGAETHPAVLVHLHLAGAVHFLAVEVVVAGDSLR